VSGFLSIRSGSLQRVHHQVLRFPPQGPVGHRSPASTVLPEHSDSLSPVSPRFVSFAWRYHRAPIIRVSAARIDASCPSQGSLGPATPMAAHSVETTGPLTFPGDPLVHTPCSQTPAGPNSPGQSRRDGAAPAVSKTKAPTLSISGLYHTASAPAVYASPRRLPGHDARLASACWPRFDGRVSHPLDPDERFQLCFLHCVLLSRAS